MNEVVLIILGAILGVAGQWLVEWLRQRSLGQRGPNVAIAKFEQHNNVFLELHNLGPDSLGEMDVDIDWLQSGHLERRALRKFFDPSQNPTTDSPARVEYLGADQRAHVAEVPLETDDGLVTVRVSGLGQRSRKIYETTSQVAVRLAPPASH